jgi:hypothetical protein
MRNVYIQEFANSKAMAVASRSGVSLLWPGVIMVVAVIVVVALILSYSSIFITAAQPCPSIGCRGVTSESSSVLMTIGIVPHDVGTTFEYPGIPASFELGTYTFKMIYNDTGYVDTNGTRYPGFEVVLNVANRTQSQTQVVMFGWSPITPTGSSSTLPSPATASLYLGTVIMVWSSTSPAYPDVKGPVVFLTVTVYQKPPYY